MNRIKLPALATLTVALFGSPATAYADCGDPGHDPCTGPVPTVDQVVAILAELSDPDIPAANKTNIVTPGFSPEEAGTIDDHLNRSRRWLPLNFVVTNIQPAPSNSLAPLWPPWDGLAKVRMPDQSYWSIRAGTG